jgi:hypothetical protein
VQQDASIYYEDAFYRVTHEENYSSYYNASGCRLYKPSTLRILTEGLSLIFRWKVIYSMSASLLNTYTHIYNILKSWQTSGILL